MEGVEKEKEGKRVKVVEKSRYRRREGRQKKKREGKNRQDGKRTRKRENRYDLVIGSREEEKPEGEMRADRDVGATNGCWGRGAVRTKDKKSEEGRKIENRRGEKRQRQIYATTK